MSNLSAFEFPSIDQVKRIRKITVGAFYKRLGDKFQSVLLLSDTQAAQGSYELKANLMRIDKSEFVDLDEPDLEAGLRATTLFSDDELTLIFKDGEQSEVPELLKLGVAV